MSPKWIRAIMLVMFAASAAYAAEVSVYPGAKLEKGEMKSAEAAQAKLAPKVRKLMGKSQIYTTEDAFEKVYAYYQKRYPETDQAIKKTNARISTGQLVSDAYFCLDDAKSVNESKLFLRIEGPRPAMFLHAPRPGDPKMPERTLIQFTEKK